MMKTILSVIAFVAFSLQMAATEIKPVRAHDSNDDWHEYFYNEQNQLFWELFGTTRREFSYNNAGQLISMNQMAWVSATGEYTLNQQETYEYDANGNMSKKTVKKNPGTSFESNWTYIYSDYVNGVATYYDEYKGTTLYYMFKQTAEFDAHGNKVKVTVTYADPDKYTDPTHETVAYDGKEAEYTWTYDANNQLVSENNGKMTLEYTYAEFDAAYAPTGLKAESNNGEVTLTWNPVTGTDTYVVYYDQSRVEVKTTSFKTTVGTGKRLFTVRALIGEFERNAATPVTASIFDAGKLPITDLAVGEIFETKEETESAEMKERTFYNIPLTWTLPEGHSEIEKIKIHYASAIYGDTEVSITDANATSYTLRIDPYEVATHNENGDLVAGIETPVFATIMYITGESDKSNIVYINPYKTLGHEQNDGISNISIMPAKNVGKYIENGKVVISKNGSKHALDATIIK